MGEKINVGKVIYAALKDIVDNRVYPLVAETTTTFPFIVYDRQSSIPKDTKDRMLYTWQHTVTIRVVAENYDESIDLAIQAIAKLYKLDGDSYDITDIQVADEFNNNVFVQNITLTIKN